MMDNLELLGMIMISLLFIIMLAFIGGAIQIAFFSSVSADNALKICESKGYSSYEDYTQKFLSSKAYAVRCKDIAFINNSIGISIVK